MSVLAMIVTVGVAVSALGSVGVSVKVEIREGDGVIVNSASCVGSDVGTEPIVVGSMVSSGCLDILPEPISIPIIRLKASMITTRIKIIATRLVLDGGCGYFSIGVDSFLAIVGKKSS